MKNWLILALFLLIGGIVYQNSSNNSFHYDDVHHIEKNPHIRNLSNIPFYFTDSRTFSSVIAKGEKAFHYRPIVMVTYAFNYWMGGLNPTGYHLVNLGFHVGSAFCVFLIIKDIMGSSAGFFAALSAGLIFLVHPFNSEVVNYISARSSVMCGFFYLLGFWCWIMFRSQKSEVRSQKSEDRSKMGFSNFLHLTSNFLPLASYFYIASLLAFLLAMLTKEIAITLTVAIWLYDLYFLQDSRLETGNWKLIFNWRTYLSYLPFVLIVVIPYLVIRTSSLTETFSHPKRDIWTQLFTEIPVLVKHWQMFLIPFPLTPIHDIETYRTFWVFPVIYSSLILIAYTAIAIFLLCRSNHVGRVISFFMFWFFIVLLPTTIIPLGLIFQEHRGYLAMTSFAVFTGIAAERLKRFKVPKVIVLLFIIILGVYSSVTIQRNKVWKDDLTLWTDTVKKSPRSPIAYAGLGIAYKNLGVFDKSTDALQKAISLGGGGEEILTAHHNLAQIYIAQGRLELAAQELEDTLKLNPYNEDLHNDLGIVYSRLGNEELAEEHFYRATKIGYNNYLPYFNLGIFYSMHGKLEKAVQAYQQALSLSPDHIESMFQLGMALEDLGKKEEAAKRYRQVLQLNMGKENTIALKAQERLKKMDKL